MLNKNLALPLGPVLFGFPGAKLSAEDRECLLHPAAGGVILFTRNYEDPEQLIELTAEIHAVRTPPLLIGVDQEGGRVQRFRAGFTQLPAAGQFGHLYQQNQVDALECSRAAGWLMAAELLAVGVDFSFAPVLDLNRELNQVIGDRAFSAQPQIVSQLATAWYQGMKSAGMAAVGKHFPGHGGVTVDSHLALPVDPRSLLVLQEQDLIPFKCLIQQGIEALMPAHIVYPELDSQPAGFSSLWLNNLAREQFGFQGVFFSDDLGMAGAAVGGNFGERALAAHAAGCDMLLICNQPAATVEILTAFEKMVVNQQDPIVQVRLARMRGRQTYNLQQLRMHENWRAASERFAGLEKILMQAIENLSDPTKYS